MSQVKFSTAVFKRSIRGRVSIDKFGNMKFAIFMFFLLLQHDLSCESKKVEDSPPRVVTPMGKIEGYYKPTINGRLFKAYEGIPYALPPTGKLRFRVPRPSEPWKGILKAKKFGSSCIQYALIPGQEPPGFVTGSEDCLYLNIYTAITDEGGSCSKDLLPVIFFIHGGFFQFGSGSLYGPEYLLDKDVTLVTINYRLGPMGFLSTEDEVVPGNMGLKDQVMALRWVNKNIRFFGGDPSRITIVGHSAGGASVHYHMLSNLSSGLFQRAMSISGTALDSWALTEGSLQKAKELAAAAKCPSHNNEDMIECMRDRPAHKILRTVDKLLPFLYEPPAPLGPVVEKGDGDFKMIDRQPIDMITSGKHQDVPWITTDVSAEGLSPAAQFLANDTILSDINKNWERIAPYMLDFNYTIPQKDHWAVSRAIRKHYLGKSPIDSSTTSQITQMVGDRLFLYNNQRAARLQAQVNKSPVRTYYFSYRGAHSYSETNSGTSINFGVSHGDDLAYVIYCYFNATTTEPDREVQKVMINLWVSFATNGEPDVGVEWPRVSGSYADGFRQLHIIGPKDLRVETTTNFGQKMFWSRLGLQENIRQSSDDDEDTY